LNLERRLAAALPLLWCILLAAYILAGTPLVPFHGDESTQIYMSRDYAYQFLGGDLSKLRYSPTPASPQEQDLRLLNGTINKYLIGLAWHLSGFQASDLNQQWDWGADWNYNQTSGHAPSPALLLVARWPSALLLAVGVFIMFGLGRAVGGRFTRYLASLYYALNPPLLLNGRRAMMEGSSTCFSLLVVLAGIWWLNKPDWRRGLLLGLAGGLALTSKHTALFTVAPVFAVCAVYTVYTSVGAALPLQNRFITVRNFMLPMVVMTLTFLALNPAWWDSPLARPALVLKMRNDLLATQTQVFGQYGSFADQLAGFGQQALVALPQYYEAPGWAAPLSEQIDAYEASPWHGVSIGGSVLGAFVLLIALMVGMWALMRRSIPIRVRTLVGAWALAALLTTLLLTPLEWGRYYLPVYSAVGLLLGLGLNTMLSFFIRQYA
jgi:4-amino-4-deoxy-L-arabinose transferase-like glycosyltransferase